MGAPMALRLVKAGYPLSACDRRSEAGMPLAAAGARICASPEETARSADTILIMVSDTGEVEEVILGPNGVLAGAADGAAVAVMSTASPEVIRTLAARLTARGIEMLDSPVSGGEAEAVDGTLTIMVGGKPDVVERVKPLLACLGKNIVHVGPAGAGQLAKACNQIVATLALEGVAEAFTFARKNGVDPRPVRDALLGGFAGSTVLDVQGKRMLGRDFLPGFRARIHQEELRLVLETAHRTGFALPGTALAAQHMNALVGSGSGELDSSALVTVIEAMNRGAGGGTK
jgi:2-hydroxy-3-oxopropionate reductase